MKKTISMLLTVCVAAGVCASCGRADETETTTQAALTTVTETTEAVTETATEAAAVETTTEEITEETTHARISEDLSGYYQRLCSESWVEICADPAYATHVIFRPDGGIRIDTEYECDGERCSYSETYSAEDRWDWENSVRFSKTDFMMDSANFIDDLDSDELIHYDAEGVISNHRLLIRESRLNQKSDFTNRLKGTSWKSKTFSDGGIDTVRIADFDVYPINETTAYLEYHEKIGSDRIRAVAVQTQNENTLDVYLITTYAEEGYCPETTLISEQWTAAS